MALDSEVVQVKASQRIFFRFVTQEHLRGLLGATCDANKRLDQQMLHTRNKQCKHPCATYFHFDYLRMRTSPQVAHHHKSFCNTEVTNPAMIFAKHSSLANLQICQRSKSSHLLVTGSTGSTRPLGAPDGVAPLWSWADRSPCFAKSASTTTWNHGGNTQSFNSFRQQKNYGVPYILIRHNRHNKYQQIPIFRLWIILHGIDRIAPMESFANWPNKYSIRCISFVAFVFPNWEPWQRVVPGQLRRDLRDWPHGAKVSPGKTRNGHLAPNGSNFFWQKDWTPLEKIIKHNRYSGGLRNKAWESASWASAERIGSEKGWLGAWAWWPKFHSREQQQISVRVKQRCL